MIVYDYLDKKLCKMLKAYADSQAFTDLDVADPVHSTREKIVTKRDPGRVTHHVEIDGRALEVINIFNDIYPFSSYGMWGLLESIMQPLSPMPSAPRASCSVNPA